jgi:hypothetical protein
LNYSVSLLITGFWEGGFALAVGMNFCVRFGVGNSGALQCAETQGMEPCGAEQMDKLAWAWKYAIGRGDAAVC